MLVEDDEDADYGYDDDDFEPEESLRSGRQSESPQRSQPPHASTLQKAGRRSVRGSSPQSCSAAYRTHRSS